MTNSPLPLTARPAQAPGWQARRCQLGLPAPWPLLAPGRRPRCATWPRPHAVNETYRTVPVAPLLVPAVRVFGPAAAQAYFLAFPALPAAVADIIDSTAGLPARPKKYDRYTVASSTEMLRLWAAEDGFLDNRVVGGGSRGGGGGGNT
jgi:hypothetical protein